MRPSHAGPQSYHNRPDNENHPLQAVHPLPQTAGELELVIFVLPAYSVPAGGSANRGPGFHLGEEKKAELTAVLRIEMVVSLYSITAKVLIT